MQMLMGTSPLLMPGEMTVSSFLFSPAGQEEWWWRRKRASWAFEKLKELLVEQLMWRKRRWWCGCQWAKSMWKAGKTCNLPSLRWHSRLSAEREALLRLPAFITLGGEVNWRTMTQLVHRWWAGNKDDWCFSISSNGQLHKRRVLWTKCTTVLICSCQLELMLSKGKYQLKGKEKTCQPTHMPPI